MKKHKSKVLKIEIPIDETIFQENDLKVFSSINKKKTNNSSS